MGKKFEDEKFCKLSGKAVAKHPDAYSELVSTPKFFCAKCIRVSQSKRNLCRPKKLA